MRLASNSTACLAAAALLSFSLGLASLADAATLASIPHPRAETVEVSGFSLARSGEVVIEAVGIEPHRHAGLTAHAWLLETATRRPVWEMVSEESEAVSGDSRQRQSRETLTLDPGSYELYYYAGDYEWGGSGNRDHGDWVDELSHAFNSNRDRRSGEYDVRDHLDGCGVTLSSDQLSAKDVTPFLPTGELEGALVCCNRMGDSQFVRKELQVDRPVTLRVYSVLEAPRRSKEPADFGWIEEATTGKRVWSMDRWNTHRAGGGQKNGRCDEEVRLDAGRYVVCFGTDDSHSYPKFNQNPPWDPLNWGLTLLPGPNFDAAALRINEAAAPQWLVDLTGVGNSEYREQGFQLSRPCDLRVHAVGEFGFGHDEFADYGWITDAKSGKTVWEMRERSTIPGGGDGKNRLFDGIVHLPAGDYIASYVSDDSHAYDDWNAGAPFWPESYGLAIGPGPQYGEGTLKRVDAQQLGRDASTLVRLVRVGSSQDREAHFRLDRPSEVRIEAVGEGKDNEMYDYGWIEDKSTGRTVWEMEYSHTRPAGGAHKNRWEEDQIQLPAGEYEAHFVTDDSHAFGDWNAERPRDPQSWGITVRLAGR